MRMRGDEARPRDPDPQPHQTRHHSPLRVRSVSKPKRVKQSTDRFSKPARTARTSPIPVTPSKQSAHGPTASSDHPSASTHPSPSQRKNIHEHGVYDATLNPRSVLCDLDSRRGGGRGAAPGGPLVSLWCSGSPISSGPRPASPGLHYGRTEADVWWSQLPLPAALGAGGGGGGGAVDQRVKTETLVLRLSPRTSSVAPCRSTTFHRDPYTTSPRGSATTTHTHAHTQRGS